MEKSNKKNIILYVLFALMIFVPIIYSKITIDIFELHKTVLSFLIIIAFLLLLLKFGFRNLSRNFLIWISFVLTIIIIIIISGLYNHKQELILKQTFFWLNILSISFLLYFLFSEFNSDFYINISRIIVIPSIIISIIGILQLFGINLFVDILSSRPGSFMNIRNFVCDYLLIILPFLLILFLNSNRISEVIIYALSLFIIILYMFAVRSRAAILISSVYFILLVIFIFYFEYFRKNKNVNFLKIFIYLIILLSSFLISKIEFPYSDPERKSLDKMLSSFSEYKYPPNISRFFYFDASIKMFKDNPFLGIGAGAWAGYFGKYQWDEFNDVTVYSNSAIYSHNDYLEYLGETGIVGFIAYCLILFFPLVKLYKKAKKEIKYLSFFMSIFGFIIISTFAFPKENINAMFIVITCIIISFIPDLNKSEKVIKIFFKYIIILISIAVLIFNYLHLSSEREYISAMNQKANLQYKEMIHILEKINNYIYPIDPNKIPLSYYLGVGYYEMKNYDKAYKCFEEALRLMPFLPQIISNKAITLYEMGETEKAEKLLLELKRNFPYYYEPQINLLVLYMKEKRFNESENLIKEIESREEGERYQFAKNYNTFLKIKQDLSELKKN